MDKKTKVAFQGEKGAYSHLASLTVFPNAEIKPCKTFEEAFQLANNNSEYKILIPITINIAGITRELAFFSLSINIPNMVAKIILVSLIVEA